MILEIAYLTHQFSFVKSGPGRFVEQLQSNDSFKWLKFTFYTDSIQHSVKNIVKVPQVKWFSVLPGYWLFRSFLFFKSVQKSKEYKYIIASNAFEGLVISLFQKSVPVFIMINDDNCILSKNNFIKSWNTIGARKTLSRFLGFYVEKITTSSSFQIIVCSNYLKNEIEVAYKLPADKISVLYPAVDLDFFKPQKEIQYASKKDYFKILFVKNDWKRGGLDILLKAISAYKGNRKIFVDIAGISDNELSTVYNLVESFGLKEMCSIKGIIHREVLVSKMQTSDLLVLPSRQEAFGILLLEAMASGIPIVACNVGGIPEVLDYGNAGFLISPESPTELLTTIERILENPTLVTSKIEYGLDHVKKFSTNVLYSNLENLLLKSVNGHRI